jgi:nitroreductase
MTKEEESMKDRPHQFPSSRPDGSPLKPIPEVLLDRRATNHFKTDPIPDEFLKAILAFGTQAPSGYNLQPWRFIVVRDRESRQRLRRAAWDQSKVSEAPVVIIAIGLKENWERRAEDVLREGARRGAGKMEQVAEQKEQAVDFLSHIRSDVWLNRHVMIAVTTMMLVAEAYGFDTAPMEGFEPAKVKSEFGIPDSAEVVALLAIGRAAEPEKPHPGRFSPHEVTFEEKFGSPWSLGD